MPPLYVVLSAAIADGVTPELKNIKTAVEESLGARPYNVMRGDNFDARQRMNVFFGCLVPEDTEVYQADQLLSVGVPIIVVGSREATANFQNSLMQRGFKQENFGQLIYRLQDEHRVRGAIHWVVNYYEATKNLAVEAAKEQFRHALDRIGISAAQDGLRRV